MLEVVREELPLRVVAREPECRLSEVVRPERAEVGELGDLVGAHACARELDHRAAEVLDLGLLGGNLLGQLAQPAELLGEPDERVHDLDMRCLAGAIGDRARRPDDRADLHLVDLGPLEAEAATARAEHGVRLAELLDASAHRVRGGILEWGKKLVERRIEQTDRHRVPGHRLEDRLEVTLLDRAGGGRGPPVAPVRPWRGSSPAPRGAAPGP